MSESTLNTLTIIKNTFQINGFEIKILKVNHTDFSDEISLTINDIKSINKINLIIKTISTMLDSKIDYKFNLNTLTLIISKTNNNIYSFNDYIKYGKQNQSLIMLGIDSHGKPIFESVDDIKSLLVSGSSGSGKSNLLHQIILSYLLLNDNSYLMLIDPKYTELSWYNKSDLKNRLIMDVAYTFEDSKKTLIVFDNLIKSRYKRMKQKGLRFSDEESILLVIDEYASLFVDNKQKKIINNLISRIASLGRAARCYLIIATQHPTNANLTNSIRVNLQSKLALHCESSNQSFNIINSREATKLKSKGEFLLKVDSKDLKFGKSTFIDNSTLLHYLKA